MRDAPYPPFRTCLLAIWVTSALACPTPSSSRPEETSPGVSASSPSSGGPSGLGGPGEHHFPTGPVRYRRVDPRDPSAVAPTREELIQALNAERIRAGVSPLKVQPVLTRVAQARADEIEKRGALPNGAESTRMLGVVQRRLVDQGYTAHGWVESVVSSDGDAAEVIAYWRTDPSWGDLLRADYSDLGIGEARLGQVPLYLLLVAKPESEVYDVEVHDLTDLGATRAAMLAGVNRLRAEAGVPPLAENARLDAAAQEHAEDMLARNYYEHKSPEGKTA